MIYTLSGIAGLILFINLALNFPPVQTWLTHIAAHYYSAKLHAKVVIGKVDFEFLKKLVLRNVYIEDRRHDTLFYTKDIKFDIGALDFRRHELIASDLIVDEPNLNLITYNGTRELNLQFIIDALASTDTTVKRGGAKWSIMVQSLVLNNGRFRLQNQNDTASYARMKLSDINVNNINLKASDIQIKNDTLQATVDNLSMHERSGFTVNKISAYLKLCKSYMKLYALTVLTPQSKVAADVELHFDGDAHTDIMKRLKFETAFRKSTICMDDISCFAQGLQGVHNCITFSGSYSGGISDLKGKNVELAWGKQSHLHGNIEVKGLPDIKNTAVYAEITSLVTSKHDIEELPLPPFNKERHISVPAGIASLGTIEFKGSFNGLISNFRAEGTLNTAIGKIIARLSLIQPAMLADSVASRNALPEFEGYLQTESFNLGRFLQNNDLGVLTSAINIKGKGLNRNSADVNLTGSVNSLYYKGYDYKGIDLKAELRDGFFSGQLAVNDANLQLKFDGQVDVKSPVHSYHFNSDIARADLRKLGFIHDTTGKALLSGHLKVDMKGNNMESLTGTLQLDSMVYLLRHQRYHLKFLNLKSTADKENNHLLTIASDYADARFSGNFPVTRFPRCIGNILSAYLPARFKSRNPAAGENENDRFSFKIKFNENTGLTTLFAPALKIWSGTVLEGEYEGSSKKLSITGKSHCLEAVNRKMIDCDLAITGDKSRIKFKTSCDRLAITDSLYAAGFKVDGSMADDTILYALKWNNDSANYADIPGSIAFAGESKTYFRLMDPVIRLNDSIWKVEPGNLVIYDSNGINAQNLIFFHNNQSISLQKDNALSLSLHRLNVKDFNLGGITKIEGTIDGAISSGNLQEAHPLFTASLNFNNLRFNRQALGNGSVNCYWNNEDQAISLNGEFIRKDTTLFSFRGDYFLRDSNNLNLIASLYQFPINMFEPYINDVFSDLSGTANGSVQITGNADHPVLNGNVTASIGRVKLNYLNTTYHVPDAEVQIKPDTIRIRPAVVLDKKDDSAVIEGLITHNNFKDIALNLNVKGSNIMCLNTDELMNDLYFGSGFASGTASIYGPLNNIHVDANVTTAAGTQFNIPLATASEVDQGKFIRFVSKDTAKKKQSVYKVERGGFEMSLIVHVTKDATTHLIFDKKDGDELIGTGNGTLQITMNPHAGFIIMGDYTIENGDYLLMLKGMLNKHFVLEQGGTIKWSGDPYNADIDLRATYHVSTSLEPFFPDDQTGIYKKNFPVNCELLLTGKLKSPQPTFKIELPSVDEGTKDIVDGYLSTPDELNTEAFSLLLLQEFQPPPQLAVGSGPSAGSSVSQLAQGNLYELMSNQLSHLLSGINNKFNVGVEIQPQSASTNQELKATFQSQIFNDRITITGDAGTMATTATGLPQQGGPPAQTANNFVGEVTVDYRVTNNIHLKAFNRANDNTLTLTNSQYIQGAGISYRQGFNTIGELWEKIKGKFHRHPKKKETTAAPK